MSSYSLAFNNGYQEIQVLDSSSNVVATYSLTTSDQSISLYVASGNYQINVASDFSDPNHGVDVGGGSNLVFDGARIGGSGICDLRDMKTSTTMDVEDLLFDLACNTFYLKYVSGAYAFRLKFADTGCCSYTEV